MPLAAMMYVTLCTAPTQCSPKEVVYKPNAASGREEQMRECQAARANIMLYQADPTRTYVCEYRRKQWVATTNAGPGSDAARQHHTNVASAD